MENKKIIDWNIKIILVGNQNVFYHEVRFVNYNTRPLYKISTHNIEFQEEEIRKGLGE